jgi:hypothetical protein
MKPLSKIFLGALLLSGLEFATSGCVSDGTASGAVYYGPHRDPWFRDDRWMDGNRRGYHDDRRGGDVYISPPRVNIAPRVKIRLP